LENNDKMLLVPSFVHYLKLNDFPVVAEHLDQ